jgi:hypothetical protein
MNLQRIVDEVRVAFVPDFRSGVFDIDIGEENGTLVVQGRTTHPEAVDRLIERLRLRDPRRALLDRVVRLPDPELRETTSAVARSAVAPVYAEPRLPAPQISQLVLGMRVDVLSRARPWLHIRSEDGYIGWVHEGYLLVGAREWATGWERAQGGEPVVSLGAELVDEDGRALMRLPWGARLLRRAGACVLPDGRSGQVAGGEVVDVDRLADWFPPRGESIARTARRWIGAPYLWGGVTQLGVDCSGLAQAVMWMHGIALPRDSDLQARVGGAIPFSDDLATIRAGDLLFFAERGERIYHVALSAGDGSIIHSALGNGGVAVNDLKGELPFEKNLRSMLVQVQRLLPD